MLAVEELALQAVAKVEVELSAELAVVDPYLIIANEDLSSYVMHSIKRCIFNFSLTFYF